MTLFIILSGIWGKKYRFEKVYIYILKHPRVGNVEYALKYTAEIEKMDKLSGLSWLFSKIGTIIRDIMTKLANFDQISNYHDFSRIPRIPIELYTLPVFSWLSKLGRCVFPWLFQVFQTKFFKIPWLFHAAILDFGVCVW